MFLYLSVPQQTLTVFRSEQERAEPVRTFEVSTALNGIGSEKNSGKTPSGRLLVRAKIGHDMPVNTVFIGRRPTGEIYSDALAQSAPDRDWILTRILWLSGLEVGQNRLGNVDTMQRYIYIHGTPDTEPMGVPKSHGCIRMRNQDVMALFDLIPVGTEMVIAS
ncbi:MAG: L,D-transpeptidase [Hydrogenovibrio crunogenus]|uniref:ErfK/YbiS/YcfS/YnhG familiy protein n=1 Tax=Hydrogenovibrio crunogenus (strain DSM 25203 / XCL-2) TaxID=317025 RepID=Q31G28_HYDCU|nr:L,D-transpeptidase [Hydrogenovibrio crunogenus]